jgi:predicted nucleic acid-binding Zn ribbon protein
MIQECHRLNFSQSNIDSLQYSESYKNGLYWDLQCSGFGVRINQRSKTYVVQYRIGSVKEVQEVIGSTNDFNVDFAREYARETITLAKRGIDPRTHWTRKDMRSTTDLTEDFVSSLPAPDPSGKQRLYWDNTLKGFGVLVSGVTNGKSFVVQRTIGSHSKRVTIGSVYEIGIEDARGRAAGLLLQLRGTTYTRNRIQRWTLQRAFDEYLKERKVTLLSSTIDEYYANFKRNFSDWANTPLVTISSKMIEEKKDQIRNRIVSNDLLKHRNPESSVKSACQLFGMLWGFVETKEHDFPRNPVRNKRKPINRPKKNCVVCGESHVWNKKFCSAICGIIYRRLTLKKSELERRKLESEYRRKERSRIYQKSYNKRQRAIIKAVRELGLISISEI